MPVGRGDARRYGRHPGLPPARDRLAFLAGGDGGLGSPELNRTKGRRTYSCYISTRTRNEVKGNTDRGVPASWGSGAHRRTWHPLYLPKVYQIWFSSLFFRAFATRTWGALLKEREERVWRLGGKKEGRAVNSIFHAVDKLTRSEPGLTIKRLTKR